MISSKQRAVLRAMGAKLAPVAQIGQLGLTTTVLDSIDLVLEAKELIKVFVLPNYDRDAKELANTIALELKADVVSVLGRKIVLFRKSKKQGVKHIEF